MGDSGPRLVGLEVGDDPDAWRAAGFAVAGDRLIAGGVSIALRGASGERGLLSCSLEPAFAGDCDGLALTAPTGAQADRGGDRAPRDAERVDAGSHPNGVAAVDHIVVTSDDVERTTRSLGRAGMTPRRSVVGARGEGDDEVVYRFFVLGTCVLELVGPTRPRGPGPARFAGLAFTTRAIDDLGDLASEPRPAVQPGRRIATLRGRELGISVPTVFLSPRPRRGSRRRRPAAS